MFEWCRGFVTLVLACAFLFSSSVRAVVPVQVVSPQGGDQDVGNPIVVEQTPSPRRIPEHSSATAALLQGVVRDQHGRAVPGVTLELGIAGRASYSTTTDVEGIFRLRGIKLGRYEVKGTREGIQALEILDLVLDKPDSFSIELTMKSLEEPMWQGNSGSGLPGTDRLPPLEAASSQPYPGLRIRSSELVDLSPEEIPPASSAGKRTSMGQSRPSLVCSPAGDYGEWRFQQNFQVECERPVADVLEVEIDHLLKRQIGAAADLPQASDARCYIGTFAGPG